MTGTTRRLAGALLFLAGSVGGTAQAGEQWRVAWFTQASGVWQPALSGELVIGRHGEQVSAYDLQDGRPIWRRNIVGLVAGPHALAANADYVYALASSSLFVLQATTGQVLRSQPLDGPIRLLSASGSVYVADSSGVKRFDASGQQLLGSTIITGTLERAEGDLVVLHRWIAKAKGPNRLSVVTLKDGSVAYEFKLLPAGDHRVASFSAGRLAFIDHSRFDRGGQRKLYYTEADATRAKKLRDVALSSHFANATNVEVDAVRPRRERVYIASFGPPDAPATLLAYDAAASQVLWTRSGNFAASDIAVFGGALWTTLRGSDARTQLVAYDADSGDRRVRIALDNEPAVGAPLPAGERVLLRTRDRLYCLTDRPEPAVAAPAAPAAEPESATPGWRRHADQQLGYALELPEDWTLETRMRKDFGQGRYAVPFVVYRQDGRKRRYVASVHVLVRPAGRQDVEQLWRTVLGYWRNRATNVKTERVRRFTVNGKKQLFGVYSFLDKRFNRQQARSLCVVHDGRAYELRARVSHSAPEGTWRRIAQIMRSFRVL